MKPSRRESHVGPCRFGLDEGAPCICKAQVMDWIMALPEKERNRMIDEAMVRVRVKEMGK